MVVFNSGVESLEQKLDRLVILISLAIAFSKHHFFQTDNQKAVLFTVFSWLELFCCCIAVAVAIENLVKTPAIVSLANFQRSQMFQNPKFVTFFALN